MSRSQKAIVVFTLLLIAIVLPLYGIKIHQKTDYTDFSVYFHAAQRVASRDWKHVYDLGDGASPFRYAPLLLPFFRPFAYLGPTSARLVWYLLQFIWFGFGFFLLYRAVKLIRPDRSKALVITCLSALAVLRFCLDCFMIGQVSSLMFLGYCASLLGWIYRKPILAGAGLFIPSVFKIGPAFLYSLFAFARPKERNRGLATPLFLTLALSALSALWLGSWERTKFLWSSWLTIVAKDSVYYDASHYGSQSLKSFLLRLAKSGWVTRHQASEIQLVLASVICGAILLFWCFRKPRSFLGRALFFSLGVFPYLWFMPETFKYSLTTAAIPIAILLCAQKGFRSNRLVWSSLLFSFLTLSIAGKDIIGDTLFFGLQTHSIPLLATLFLALAVLKEAWKASEYRFLGKTLGNAHAKIGPWEKLPESIPKLDVSFLIPLPLQKIACVSPRRIKRILEDSHSFLKTQWPDQFEILLIPFGDRVSQFHPTLEAAKKFASSHEEIKILSAPFKEGRGAALRLGFLHSRGRALFCTHPEQPCEVSFFKEAFSHLATADLVRGNRRLAESRFKVPVKLLPLVYGRHRLGLLFNKLVRLFLPIQTTDTHSGVFAMNRKLALHAFAVQATPDFLFELELAAAAKGTGARELDLPVTIDLAQEKGKRRILSETLHILFGLPFLAWRYRSGYYDRSPTSLESLITADDWGLSPGINQGILELAQKGVIKRVSILANCPYAQDRLEELKAVPGIELGLHFNLTYGKDRLGSPFQLLWDTPLPEIRKRLQAQLDALKRYGVETQYLDGHHHIHLVPGILDGVADLLRTARIKKLRLPYDSSLWFTTKAPLNILSCLAKAKLKKNGFESLPCSYPQFHAFMDQGKLRLLLEKNKNSEVIVHPAAFNDIATLDPPDPYQAERVLEFYALRMLKT